MKPVSWHRSWKTSAAGVLGLVALVLLARIVLQKHSSDEIYQIPPAEISTTVAAANGGDVAAAERLQDHFMFWEQDRATGLVWMRRAADLGSVGSRDELIGELQRSERVSDRQEARALAARWGRPAHQ